MISPISTTNKYILQPSLMGMHNESLEWLSTIALWKRELVFFQKLLDKYAPQMVEVESKKEIDHYQNLIIYYDGELVDLLRKKLKEHEASLARMLKELNESDVEYFQEHRKVIDEVASFARVFAEFKNGFFEMIEKQMVSQTT